MAISVLDTLVSIETEVKALNNENTSTVSALSTVAASATSVEVLAANPARKGVMLMNDSNAVVYIALAATASVTAFSFKLPGGALYENEIPNYTGVISAIWANANGSLRVTELT